MFFGSKGLDNNIKCCNRLNYLFRRFTIFSLGVKTGVTEAPIFP